MAPGVPTGVPAAQLAAAQPASQQQQPQNPQLTAANAAAAATNAYPGYNLAQVDMSAFNGIDWASMYGMNMYV